MFAPGHAGIDFFITLPRAPSGTPYFRGPVFAVSGAPLLLTNFAQGMRISGTTAHPAPLGFFLPRYFPPLFPLRCQTMQQQPLCILCRSLNHTESRCNIRIDWNRPGKQRRLVHWGGKRQKEIVDMSIRDSLVPLRMAGRIPYLESVEIR